jgi:hypothetical protein
MTRNEMRNPLGTKEAVQEMLERGEIEQGRRANFMERFEMFLERHPFIAGVVLAICAYEMLAIVYVLTRV